MMIRLGSSKALSGENLPPPPLQDEVEPFLGTTGDVDAISPPWAVKLSLILSYGIVFVSASILWGSVLLLITSI